MWILEVATEYPRSRFTGIDIALTYPIHIKPHNVEFLQANIVTKIRYYYEAAFLPDPFGIAGLGAKKKKKRK